MTTTPKTPAEKLAAIVPDPTAENPAKSEKAKPANAEAPSQEPQTAVSAGGPAPPLHTLELEEEKKPAGRRRAPAPKPTAASNNAAKKELQKLLPSSHRVHVYKRNRHGSQSFVNDYSASDLAQQGSMERFLKEYVVPEYGYGEYALYMQLPGKDLQPLSSVSVEEPLSHKRRTGGNDTKELLELIMSQQEKARAEAAQQKDPMEQMRDMLGFLQGMSGGEKEKSSMDPMMLMFMMMQQQNRPAPSTGPDPIILKLIDRLDRMEDQTNAMAMMPPPPPPPPPASSPMDGFAAMMQVLAEQQASSNALLVEALRSKSPERDPVQDLAKLTALTGATDDRMTTKDFLAMLPTLKDMIAPDRGKSSMGEALDTLRTVKLLEREFSPGEDQEGGFWAFLRELISSDAGTRIAEAITAKEGATKVEARHGKRRLAAENAEREATGAEAEAEAEAESLPIPESYRTKYAVELNNAGNAPERLKALVTGLQHLGMHVAFRPYVAKVFGLTKENRKMEALHFLGEFLDALIDAGALEVEACQRAVENLEDHWDLVRTQLKMEVKPEVYPEGYEPPSQGEASGEHEIDEEGEDEVDPPRKTRRNPARDMEPTHPDVRAQQGLEAEGAATAQ